MTTHTIIDIFAGPGGLGEGFASYTRPDGHSPFRIGVSVEKDSAAHATLSLRALYRKCLNSGQKAKESCIRAATVLTEERSLDLDAAAAVAGLQSAWRHVRKETLLATLGTSEGNSELSARIRKLRSQHHGSLILIGGPPCQAYSLVGRARNRGVRGYRPEADERHYLYQQYLSILRDFSPDIFLMENVKGILSSKLAGNTIFETILGDLRSPGGTRAPAYEIFPLVAPVQGELLTSEKVAPRDFIVRSECFGVPQTRHRVILLGIRRSSGIHYSCTQALQTSVETDISLGAALAGLPPLRSGLSESPDSAAAWRKVVETQRERLIARLRHSDPGLRRYVAGLEFSNRLPRMSRMVKERRFTRTRKASSSNNTGLRLSNHMSRSHMADDLCRYLYCASFAAMYGRSPVSREFPTELSPDHRSWASGHFPDRFRVQLMSTPASTITSHLAKDGHHFIHWDPTQCRSLTVREAARAQTFPDDYIFLGNRTQQFSQVGNAVPPLLARQIAAVVDRVL